MLNVKYGKMKRFTLVEIIVAMSIFAVMMLLVMQIFGSMQNVWASSSTRNQTYQNARVIMDLITADLQSAYYELDPAAGADSWWCYFQKSPATGVFTDRSRLWFVTHRQKSVQAQNSSLVEVGYWLEEVTSKDGQTLPDSCKLFRLRNGVVSNIGTLNTLYNFRTSSTLPNGLTDEPLDSNLVNASTVLDDNVVSFTVKPYLKLWNAGSSKYGYSAADPSGTGLKRLPGYVQIELVLLDDDPQVRERYKNATGDDKKDLVRKFTRVIEIDRGQHYE